MIIYISHFSTMWLTYAFLLQKITRKHFSHYWSLVRSRFKEYCCETSMYSVHIVLYLCKLKLQRKSIQMCVLNYRINVQIIHFKLCIIKIYLFIYKKIYQFSLFSKLSPLLLINRREYWIGIGLESILNSQNFNYFPKMNIKESVVKSKKLTKKK